MLIEPLALLPGTILIVIPHMDDCVLAVGGTIAKHPRTEQMHVVYATDGMGSPEPLIPWREKITADLGATREREATEAMTYLGVPLEQLHFLRLPDGRLGKHRAQLSHMLFTLIKRIEPDVILLPFRYDRHPDHLAINHVLTDSFTNGSYKAKLIEYFVYFQWRLLPDGDVRKYIRPDQLLEVDTTTVAARKRAALNYFKSQTTLFYSWQRRPNLTNELLDMVSTSPEYFVRYTAELAGAAIFDRMVPWIRTAHRMEPVLKKRKDQVVALWSRRKGS